MGEGRTTTRIQIGPSAPHERLEADPYEPDRYEVESAAVRGERSAVRIEQVEHELYTLFGSMLGMLEVLATDVVHPLDERQRRWLTDAMRYGNMLQDRVDALVFVSSEEAPSRVKRVPCVVKRVLEHAARGAMWGAIDRGIEVILPIASEWGDDHVLGDASYLDRTLRGIIESMVDRVGRGGSVRLLVQRVDDQVVIEIIGHANPQASESTRAAGSALLTGAWQRVIALHEGRLELEPTILRARVSLPTLEPS